MRRTLVAAIAAASALLLSIVAAAPAASARGGESRITVRADDYTPQRGETFVIRGRYQHDGRPARGHKVRLQTYRQGWHNLAGAVVTTDSDGRYRMRVILFVHGVRDLRVMGVSTDAHRNSFHRFVVEVQ